MEKNSEAPKTLGHAIDEIIHALSSLDETARVTAIRAACEHLKIQPPEGFEVKPPAPSGSGGPSVSGTLTPGRIVDIKALRQEKQPSSANEMAAVIAFYLSELVPQSEKKQEVQVEDVVRYFKQAGFPLPRVPKQLLANAKNAGYFDGGKGGVYKLNPVGYNLVAHNLPRASSGSAVVSRRGKARASQKRAAHKRGR